MKRQTAERKWADSFVEMVEELRAKLLDIDLKVDHLIKRLRRLNHIHPDSDGFH